MALTHDNEPSRAHVYRAAGLIARADEPEDASDRPTTLKILRVLERAGAAGEQAGVIAGSFTEPASGQRRNALVNQFLGTLARSQRVTRSHQREPSLRYHNTPVYRWFITDSGIAYLALGGWEGTIALRKQMHDRARRERADRQQLRTAVLVNPWLFTRQPASKCLAQRHDAIVALRDHALTLADIGDIFNLSRERIRQIVSEDRPVCRRPCCDHTAA